MELLIVHLVDVVNPEDYWGDKKMILASGDTIFECFKNAFIGMIKEEYHDQYEKIVDNEIEKSEDIETLISQYHGQQFFITDVFKRIK